MSRAILGPRRLGGSGAEAGGATAESPGKLGAVAAGLLGVSVRMRLCSRRISALEMVRRQKAPTPAGEIFTPCLVRAAAICS